jgi:hypothetical protein
MAKAGRKREVNTDEAAEMTAIMLGQRAPKHVIKKALNSHFRARGGVSPRSFETILARAREMMLARDSSTRQELRTESRRYYESLLADKRVPWSVKVRAQQALDKLYNLPLRAPARSPDGGSSPPAPRQPDPPTDPSSSPPAPASTLPERVREFDFAALRLAMLNAHQPAEGVDAQRN